MDQFFFLVGIRIICCFLKNSLLGFKQAVFRLACRLHIIHYTDKEIIPNWDTFPSIFFILGKKSLYFDI
jgi:hypothetical protein